ncbi:ArnT family glycosyltransferase [Candidatus Leptofilum sp.]|uniref:ArnT family glycosyltransferase n=1 Tax=Candidatus Leptofilum sp. TaxID=3241576 RepID=UPI003B5AFD07
MNNLEHNQLHLPNKTQKDSPWFFVIIAAAFVGLYLFNISGWLIHDDEGTDLYEVWQLSIGKQPGIDFVAEQQPLFLTIGQSLLNLSEDSVTAVGYVRLASAIQVLAGAIFLGFVVKQLWDVPTAVLTLGVTLTSGLIYEQARLYRPDPMMFAWELFGLGFVLLAVKLGKRPYWAAAGVAYGIAVLTKLFGIFPVIGLVFFFLYLFIKQPQQWQEHLRNGIAFSIPFLLVSGGVSLLLYSQLGFYYQEVFNQHLSLGQEKTILDQMIITVSTYLSFILVNMVFLFILPLLIMNRRSGESNIGFPENAIVNTQLIVPLLFIFITRPIFPRYFMFLAPTLSLILALQLKGFFNKISSSNKNANPIISVLVVVTIIFGSIVTFPNIYRRLVRQENDTIALAHFIQDHTAPNDIVVSDYASLNFHAERESIYEASIIAGGRIGGGIVTGELLIKQMEETQTELVLVHVAGGTPHQLIKLIDFELFQSYLDENFELITVFNRTEQKIEVYARK